MPARIGHFPLPAAASTEDACEAAALQLVTDILTIHAAVTIPLGGLPSLISPQLLDSAAHRPFFMYGGQFMYQSGLEQAAALLQSLAQNHAFEDGNKRTAIVSCLYFLERCGYWQQVALLTAKERDELEMLALYVTTGVPQGRSRGSFVRVEVPEIAQALDDILSASRNRRFRVTRLVSAAFREIIDLFLR